MRAAARLVFVLASAFVLLALVLIPAKFAGASVEYEQVSAHVVVLGKVPGDWIPTEAQLESAFAIVGRTVGSDFMVCVVAPSEYGNYLLDEDKGPVNPGSPGWTHVPQRPNKCSVALFPHESEIGPNVPMYDVLAHELSFHYFRGVGMAKVEKIAGPHYAEICVALGGSEYYCRNRAGQGGNQNLTPPPAKPPKANNPKSSKACFIFAADASWSPGQLGFHNGCKKEACPAINGFDYWADKGTPLLAPFDGKITSACIHDGVGNTVIKLQSPSGWTMGALHGRCAVSGGQQVKAGDIIGFTDQIGWANGVNHWHIWFSKNGVPTKNHKQFWSCVDGQPSGNAPSVPGSGSPQTPSGQTPTTPATAAQPSIFPKWLNELITKAGLKPAEVESSLKGLLEKIDEFIKSNPIEVPSVPAPTTTTKQVVESKHYKFSVQAQKPGNAEYQNNIRRFFAWPPSGQNLEKLKSMDLENFEGSFTLPGQSSTTVNKVFGSGKYEQGQGMTKPPGYNWGDGVCHSASMIAYVAGVTGLEVHRDVETHSVRIPGVPQEWEATVCIDTGQYPCPEHKDKDITIRNTNNYPVTIRWKVSGDTVEIWTEYEKEVTTTPSTPTGTTTDKPKINPMVFIIGGLVLLILAILYFVLRPDKGVESAIWIADNSPKILRYLRIAWSESKKLTIAILLLAAYYIVTRPGTYQSFTDWFKGVTTFNNKLVVFIAAYIVIRIVVSTFRAKIPWNSQSAVSTVKSEKVKIGWIIFGILYAILPLPGDASIPFVDDIIVNIIATWLAMPKSKRGGCGLKTLLILLLIVAVVLGGLHLVNQKVNEVKLQVWESIKPFMGILPDTWQQAIQDFLGVKTETPTTPTPGKSPPEPPATPQSGSCNLGGNVPSSVSRWCDIIEKYAQKRNIPPNLIAAIIYIESKGNPNAISACGAVGLMQVVPSDNGGLCGTGFPERPTTAQLKDPDFNIKSGTQILAWNFQRYKSWAGALQHYGPAGHQTYYKTVMNLWQKYEGGKKVK